MNDVRRPLPLLVLPLVAGALSENLAAQTFTVSPSQISIADAAGQPGWIFGRSVAGELNGDGVSDVVVMDGNHATLLIDPSVYDAQIPYPRAVHDVDVLRPLSGAGRSALVSVGPNGLESAEFVSGPPATFAVSTIAGAGDWVGAKLVRVGDVDGDGDADIVGLAATRTRLITRVWNGSTYVAGPTIDTYGAVDEFVLYDRNGDGAKELGCRTNLGFEAYDLAGALVQGIPGYQRGDALARIRAAGTTHDDVVWIAKGPSGAAQYLVIVRMNGVTAPVALGALGTGALAAGDVDRDGFDDLVLNQTAANGLVLLYNTYDPAHPPSDPNANLFQSAGGARADLPQLPTEAPSTASAWPLLFDGDNDGDLDFAQPIESTKELFVQKSRIVDHVALRPTISEAAADWDPATNVVSYTALMPATLAAGANTLVVRLWRKDGEALWTTPVAEAAQETALDGSSAYTVTLQLDTPTEIDEIHFIEQRLVRKVGGVVEAVHPASIYGLYNLESESALAFLQTMTGATASMISFGNGIFPDRVEIGSIVPEEEVPDFEKGKEPQPNPDPP